MDSWDLKRGDALTVLPTLPHEAERTLTTPRSKYVSGDARHQLADFAGDNRDQRSYTAWLTLILAQCQRVARPGASVLVFSDWRQLPATSDALQAGGWTWRGIVSWHKPVSRPTRNGFRRECEYILWGSLGEPHAHEPPIYLPGWYSYSQPRGSKRHHITAKPVELLAELVRACPAGGVVLDPFAGSASAGVAALTTGRRYIGVEITSRYAAIATDRLRETAAELR